MKREQMKSVEKVQIRFFSVAVLMTLLLTMAAPSLAATPGVPGTVTQRLTASDGIGGGGVGNAYSIRVQQGTTIIVTVVSHIGSLAIQYDSNAPTTPVRGAIIRYSDGAVIGLDYATQTYFQLSLDEAIARSNEEHALVTSQTTIPGIGPSLALAQPPASLQRTPGTVHILGIPTRVYVLTDNTGRTWRLYYANKLPRPPGPVRQKLATTLAGGLNDGSSECAQDSDDCEDNPRATPAQQVAGRVLLRTEIQVDGTWNTVIDAQEVNKVKVSETMFDIPVGWQQQAMAAAPQAGALKSSLTVDASSPLPYFIRRVQSQTTASVLKGTGPAMSHPEVYHFFWGRTFADPAHSPAINEFYQAFANVFSPSYAFYVGSNPYTFGLPQYNFEGGASQGAHIINDDPPSYAGSGSGGAAPAAGAFVLNQAYSGNGPLVWWRVGGHDPLYAIYIPEDKVDQSDWTGFHFNVEVFVEHLIPFPFSLLAHPAMPYFVVKVPAKAPAMPLEGLFFRGNCKIVPNLCTVLPSFDDWTERASHEFVEAVTDPIPFFGWHDPLKQPAAIYSEIADICEFTPYPWGSKTGVNRVALATYWSNGDNACVPESRPTLTIFSPHDGDTVAWQAGGGHADLGGSALDPLDGDISSKIRWSVDGVSLGQEGQLVTATSLALGPHEITATVTDSQGLKSTQTVNVQVVAQPPVASIFSPAEGATFAADDTIVFRGDGFDYQDGALPNTALVWQVNGVNIGTGRLVTSVISTQGPATVSLTVTNSAGLSTTATHTINITAAQGNPSVLITQPADGSQFRYSTDVITFEDSAHAAGGGAIPDTAIRWSSDIDGFLGTGSVLLHTLSGGPCGISIHHITVIVTDTNGKTASDTITVQVGQIC